MHTRQVCCNKPAVKSSVAGGLLLLDPDYNSSMAYITPKAIGKAKIVAAIAFNKRRGLLGALEAWPFSGLSLGVDPIGRNIKKSNHHVTA